MPRYGRRVCALTGIASVICDHGRTQGGDAALERRDDARGGFGVEILTHGLLLGSRAQNTPGCH